MNFILQITKAKAEIKETCKTTPWLFPQWQNYESSKAQLEIAKRKYLVHKKVWEDFSGQKVSD